MLARVGFAVLVLMVLGGLAGAAALAQSPSPTPTATATRVGCDFPTPTPAPGETPYPGSMATAAPTAPTDLRAELVADPELVGGLAVQLSWQDNADNETCYQVMVRIDGEPLRAHGGFVPYDASTTGPQTLKDIPDRTGLYCYQVYYGNSAGRSYSNEVCVTVEALPVSKTATPTSTPPTVEAPMPSPLACNGEGPIGTPGAPNPPTNLRVELVEGSAALEGVVRVEWYDNANNEACHFLERKVGEGEWLRQWAAYLAGTEHTGPMAVSDFPGQVGVHCYRVFYANAAGRSAYSNEACVNVEVVPNVLVPTPPPWPCQLRDDPAYSEQAPSPPTDLTATLVADPTVSGGLLVRLVWQHIGTNELCYRAQRQEPDGRWQWFATGKGNTEVDSQPLPGVRCYRVATANEHGRSAYSNEACATGTAVTVTPTPITTPAPSTPVTPAAVPVLGAGGGDSTDLPWWVLATAASALVLGLSALGVVIAARGRR